MKKRKIAFMAPEWKWWPYFIYKNLINWLGKLYWNKFELYFFNSKKDWLKLHFKKYDYIFSVIPFLFKPIWAKKYIFNPRWNFQLEKKNNNLWNKLLYLSKNNLKFADNIWLTSYFLADKLDFREKYNDKIFILPNSIDFINNKNKIKELKKDKRLNILTVSSTKFIEKWKGIIDLWNELSNIKDIRMNWTIIAWWNQLNKEKLQNKFNKINFWDNIDINWIDWVDKEKLVGYYNDADIFLYWTRLDTFWTTILEAMSFWLPCILLEYELWNYIFPKNIVTSNIEKNLLEILDNYSKKSVESLQIVDWYSFENNISHFSKTLIK